MPEWFKGPVLKTGEANYLRGFESLSIRYGNLGGLRKIPFLAVYCPLVPCFLVHDANQHKKAIPPLTALFNDAFNDAFAGGLEPVLSTLKPTF